MGKGRDGMGEPSLLLRGILSACGLSASSTASAKSSVLEGSGWPLPPSTACWCDWSRVSKELVTENELREVYRGQVAKALTGLGEDLDFYSTGGGKH